MRSFKVGIIAALSFFVSANSYGQTNAAGETPQYLFSSFAKGRVLIKGNKFQETVMNYNTVTECIVFEQNGKLLDMTNLSTIDTIYLHNSRFIPVGKAFYEVVATAPVPLFIQHKGELLPPGKPVGYGGTSEVAAATRLSSVQLSSGYYNLQLPPDFKVKITPVYWLMRDGTMVNFLNERQLLKLFPEKEEEIKDFIKKGRLKIERREDLVKIIRFCGGFAE
jgi:hypothetical protein